MCPRDTHAPTKAGNRRSFPKSDLSEDLRAAAHGRPGETDTVAVEDHVALWHDGEENLFHEA